MNVLRDIAFTLPPLQYFRDALASRTIPRLLYRQPQSGSWLLRKSPARHTSVSLPYPDGSRKSERGGGGGV